MFKKQFELSEAMLPLIEEIGQNMPGGFLIYKASEPEELIYANQAVFQIFGCEDLEDFRNLTGYTFKGLIHPEDYDFVVKQIHEQISHSDDRMDYVEYRIIRKDGKVRWVEDFGHFSQSESYGGIFYAFICDITRKHEQLENDNAIKIAVMKTLTYNYDAIWLVQDIESELCYLYHDERPDFPQAKVLHDIFSSSRYSQIKDHYIKTMVYPDDQERLVNELDLSHIMSQLAQRTQYSITYKRNHGASFHYYRVDIGAIAMPEGKTGLTISFKDVDEDTRERLQIEQSLQEAKIKEIENARLVEEVQSAAKLADLMGSVASLLSNMPAMSFSKDAETGRYLACNQPFAEYCNKKSPQEVIGLTDFEIFDFETASHFRKDDQITLTMDKPYIFFEDVPDATGSNFRNLQTTKLKFVDASGRLCTLGMCVDVTEMARIKSAEAKQQEMEQRLALQEKLLEEQKQRDLQDKMITALASDYRSVYHVDLDKDQAVCYRADPTDKRQHPPGVVFPFYETFAGYANNHVTENYREGFLKFIEPDHIREGLATNLILSYRYLANRDGREYYEMLRIAGVRHAEERDDHLVHAIGLGLTVIDEEMRASMARNQALVTALAAAEEANKAKSAFLSSMSHEIRTPMNAIIGLNSLALQHENLPEETRNYLEKIGESARHLLGLINDILDMSRIESGRLTLRKEEFSFKGMLEQINTIVTSQCGEKGLTYKCNMIGGINDYYIGDDMKLKQVLINILSNAIKFTDAPGYVTFTIERTKVYKDQSIFRFTIKDTGIGMDEAFIPKIFDSFTQENASRNNRYGSTGLGMAITKNIVELMNGSISVQSKKGAGSTFTVVVALKNSSQHAVANDKIRPKDLHVLVIDDEEIAAEHARVVLAEAGIQADLCKSGQDALPMLDLQQTKQEPYNLVLLDWKMPGLDGLETAKRIRERFNKETMIILLTSFPIDEIAEQAQASGIDGFLAKPLFASSLIAEYEKIKQKTQVPINKRADLKGKHILLGEDIFINAEIMKQLISMKEAEIDHGENGRAVVDLFARSKPFYYDAILMDVQMPQVDGLQATAEIRALDRPDVKDIPIIAMTANAFDEDVQRSLQAGMNAHLSKPVEPERLYATLEELIFEYESKKAA